MFFYLSFLRPLPHSSDSRNDTFITPQIANDLRTSHLEEATDIFYTWSLSLSDCASASTSSSMARKLTTWRTSSMYKVISIPLPPNPKPGQEWRLSLSCAPTNESFIIDLGAKAFGTRPFPVISMPIQFCMRGSKGKALGKQEQIERLYSIPAPRETGQQSSIFCIREQTSFELDKKIWDSGLSLSSWLTHLMLSTEPTSNPLVQQLKISLTSPASPLKILELGTGTGIVSICLSTLLETMGCSLRTNFFATDLPSAIELIEHNICTNKLVFPSVDLQPLVLDWNDETLPSEVSGKIDLIVMADVTYNTVSFPALVGALNKLIQSSKSSSGGQTPCILLAYKQRDPAERTLWTMLIETGINLSLVDNIHGVGAEAVEIWMMHKRGP